jgi:hypothetical protein
MPPTTQSIEAFRLARIAHRYCRAEQTDCECPYHVYFLHKLTHLYGFEVSCRLFNREQRGCIENVLSFARTLWRRLRLLRFPCHRIAMDRLRLDKFGHAPLACIFLDHRVEDSRFVADGWFVPSTFDVENALVRDTTKLC